MKTGPDGFESAESKQSKALSNDPGAIIRKIKWLIGIIFLWAIIFFGVQWQYDPKLHTATTRIEILGSHDLFDPRIWFQEKFAPMATSNVQEHAEAFKSRDLARSVVAALPPRQMQELQLALVERPVQDRGVSAMAKSLSPFREYHTDEGLPEPTDYICDRLVVSAVTGCNMLDISIQAPSQTLAVKLLEEYLRIFSAKNLEKRRLQTLASAENLNEGATETLKQLKDAEAILLDFVVENGFTATEDSGLGRVFRLINRHIEDSRPVAHSADQKPDFKEMTHRMYLDLGKLESEQSGMSAALGANHPRMMALTAKIDFLRDRMDYFRRNASLDLTQSCAKQNHSQSGENETPEKSRTSLNKAKSLEEQYYELKRDLDSKADFHDLVRKEAQQWNIKTRTISNNIVVIDGPRPGRAGWLIYKTFL
ncbi:MAG: hypothetical protein V1897_02790 [Pseudomonadota bacterium]